MPLITIVEDYIYHALQHAEVEQLEDGTIGATIPEFPGLVAYGADIHECAREMATLLEETLKNVLSNKGKLPVVDDIDLNSAAGKILASYHDLSAAISTNEIYADETALDEAFGKRGEPVA